MGFLFNNLKQKLANPSINASKCIRTTAFILTAILVAVSLIMPHIKTQPIKLILNWHITSDPLPYNNTATATCTIGEKLYVIGAENYAEELKYRFRIEERRLKDGELIDAWSWLPKDAESGLLSDCTTSGNTLYVVGAKIREVYGESAYGATWIILKLKENLKLQRIATSESLYATSITTDGKYLYIAGTTYRRVLGIFLIGSIWRIEKRDPSSLKLLASYESVDGQPLRIRVNPVTGDIWIVGYSENTHRRWRIEILDKNLNPIAATELDLGRSAYSVTFDNEGNAYVTGDGGIVKLTKHGAVLTFNTIVNGVKAVFTKNILFVVASDGQLVALDTNLRILDVIQLPGNPHISEKGGMGKDQENVYIAGQILIQKGHQIWAIYSARQELLTEIKVIFADGAPAPYAEVYVDGEYVGTTDINGKRAALIKLGQKICAKYIFQALDEELNKAISIKYAGCVIYNQTPVIIVLQPTTPLLLYHVSTDKQKYIPGETATINVRWVFARSLTQVTIIVVDWTGKQVTKLWDGPTQGSWHKLISKTFTIKTPNHPGNYEITITAINITQITLKIAVKAPPTKQRVQASTAQPQIWETIAVIFTGLLETIYLLSTWSSIILLAASIAITLYTELRKPFNTRDLEKRAKLLGALSLAFGFIGLIIAFITGKQISIEIGVNGIAATLNVYLYKK